MLKTSRRILAAIFWLGITFLLLDVTDVGKEWFSWMAKLQLLPAIMRLDYIVVPLLILITLLFGRIYCSIICPTGVLQDLFAWIGGWRIFRKNKKAKFANRYCYSKPKTWLRLTVLLLFIVMVIAGLNGIYILIAPYSAYGRMVAALLQPLYIDANNMLARWSEANDNYMFSTAVQNTLPAVLFWIAAISALILFVLAFLGGRTYCNTICPVGTILGYLSRFSWFKMQVDEERCIKCGLCEKNCKAACIKVEKGKPVVIDYSRCVTCGNCQQVCIKQVISYVHKNTQPSDSQTLSDKTDEGFSRRNFLTLSATMLTAAALKAKDKTTDGGLAAIEQKKDPVRHTKLTPPGSLSARNLQQRCTACQLCITKCPEGVLHPSDNFDTFLQPEMQYDRSYCRPECTRCSQVCPAGAIQPISIEQKTAIQIGHAVWVKENCIPLTDGVVCGNCARHCPSGAIQMVPAEEGYTLDAESGRWLDTDGRPADMRTLLMVPTVNTEKCIGCGACEYICPSRPFSAIYVEGHEVHREI